MWWARSERARKLTARLDAAAGAAQRGAVIGERAGELSPLHAGYGPSSQAGEG